MRDLRERVMSAVCSGRFMSYDGTEASRITNEVMEIIAHYEQKAVEAIYSVDIAGMYAEDARDEFIEAIKQVMKDE